MKLTINLLELERTQSGGHIVLPSVSSFDDVPRLKMISSISLGSFYNEDEARQLMNSFPKSYKARLATGFDWDAVKKETLLDKKYWQVFFRFNFLWTNKTTGEENEAAIDRLHKTIKKIKEIINTCPVS